MEEIINNNTCINTENVIKGTNNMGNWSLHFTACEQQIMTR